jgi:hypothetical protein
MQKATSQKKQDRLFLKARRGGMSARDIARRFDTCIKAVYNGIERARLAEAPAGTEPLRPPKLVPLFPLTPLTPSVACPHYGPIRKGSIFCCMVCNRSGMDFHRALRLNAKDVPKRDPKPKPPAEPVLTRKEKRSILSITRPSKN